MSAIEKCTVFLAYQHFRGYHQRHHHHHHHHHSHRGSRRDNLVEILSHLSTIRSVDSNEGILRRLASEVHQTRAKISGMLVYLQYKQTNEQTKATCSKIEKCKINECL